MYEDSWYSFVPDVTSRNANTAGQPHGHHRKESLLQQPNGTGKGIDASLPLENVYEPIERPNTPPQPTLTRRAASYSDFYHVVKAQLSKDEQQGKRKRKNNRKSRAWDALILSVPGKDDGMQDQPFESSESLDSQLLSASHEKYTLYTDQLTLTERHLDGLIDDATATLKLLSTLADSFESVDAQTSTFQSHCEDLISEQDRLEKLANEVSTDLYYYEYLDAATRRLNAPGAGRLVDGEAFYGMVEDIDACIRFMNTHENYRERDSYLARYNALLTKALHLLDHGFTSHLEKVSAEMGRQILATKSVSARHALAFGRFEEMIMQSFSLIPNVRKVIRRAYDQYGRVIDSEDASTYANSATTLFHTYFATRDRDLKSMVQHELSQYDEEIKSLSVETASRNFIKQTFETLHSEDDLFVKIFDLEPVWNTSEGSVFQEIKLVNTSMAHPGNLTPLATKIQAVLQPTQLQPICNVVGWIAQEYSVAEGDEDVAVSSKKYREYAARLLVDHLWPFTDSCFDAEVTKSITKAPLPDGSLKIEPVVDGVSSSNAHPLVKRAIELLAMFDLAMPKERSTKNSSVVFKIVRETIQVLQRAEARIKSLKNETDGDLFMVKNLLIIKNELVSLEIGDIRSQPPAMQHFGQIWETLSPQNWFGFFSGMVTNNSLWSRGAPSVSAKTLTVEDMSEQLDELLRQSIYAFTERWGGRMNDSQSRKAGSKPIAKLETELEKTLQTAFSNQPEVIAKLNEAIQINAKAQSEASDKKKGARRY